MILRILEIFIIILIFIAFFIGGMTYQEDYTKKEFDRSDYMLKPVPIMISENLHKESKYNIHTWDCSNKTDENIRRMHQQGYLDARYVGVKYNDVCHAITCYTQCIENNKGTFINPNINNNYSFDRVGCRNITH